jgi:hypothetical protein
MNLNYLNSFYEKFVKNFSRSRFSFVSLPGANAMIAICGDFRRFSATKLVNFLKTDVVITFFCMNGRHLNENRQSFNTFLGKKYFQKRYNMVAGIPPKSRRKFLLSSTLEMLCIHPKFLILFCFSSKKWHQ